jgi:acyl carrier protein
MRKLLDVLRTALDLSEPIWPDTPLLSSGVVDSFRFVVLVQALERAYDVSLQTEEIDVDSFDTPCQMLEFIERAKV